MVSRSVRRDHLSVGYQGLYRLSLTFGGVKELWLPKAFLNPRFLGSEEAADKCFDSFIEVIPVVSSSRCFRELELSAADVLDARWRSIRLFW